MRNGTKSLMGVLSLGILAAGYQAGQVAEISTGFSAAAALVTNTPLAATAPAPVQPVPAPVAPSATAVAPAKTATATPAKKAATTPAKTATSAKKTTTPVAPAPVKTVTPVAPPAPATATSSTQTGSAIRYKFGTVQVSVTKANGKITAVNLLQATATDGRQAAFSPLVTYAIQANGSGFGNLSGATFTVNAFKQSLESALAKF